VDRKAGRTLAKATLQTISGIASVTAYEPDTFAGSAFAVVHSKSLAMLQDARGDFDGPCEIWVTIYVRRQSGDGADTEDDLDDLTRSCMRALWDAFYGEAQNLQIGPSEAGIPTKPPDGKAYRMERFPVRFSDNED